MEKLIVYPAKAKGEVTVPASKSISHRAVICASLSEGSSLLRNIGVSDDVKATIRAMRAFGAKIVFNDGNLTIEGIGRKRKPLFRSFDVGESASSFRFVVPLFFLFMGSFKITGSERLLRRLIADPGMNHSKGFMKTLFKTVKTEISGERFKISFHVNHNTDQREFEVDGSISSQFVGGMLFMLPLMPFDTILRIKNLCSWSYVRMTIAVLKAFGISIEIDSGMSLCRIKGNQSYQAREYDINGDFTLLGNYLVLGSFGNGITVSGIEDDGVQEDRLLLKLFPKAEAIPGGYQTGHDDSFPPFSFDLNDHPDLGPILAVFGVMTGCVLRNCGRLRYKETDRLRKITEELGKLGIETEIENEDLIIRKKEIRKSGKDIVLDSGHDHRLLMAFSILATLWDHPLTIKNYRCVSKSYPGFLTDLAQIGVKWEIYD